MSLPPPELPAPPVPAPPGRTGGLSSRTIITIVVVVCVTLVLLAVVFAVMFVGVFRTVTGVVGEVIEEGAVHLEAVGARDAFVTALAEGDTDRFAALWCADPPPRGDAEAIAAQVEAEQDTHGPVTDASVQGWEPLPRGPSAAHILVEHGTVRRSWTAILVDDPDRGWRVCGAGPHPD